MNDQPQTSEDKDKEFMELLEQGVRDVLKNRKSKPSERVAAISAGTKLLAIKNKIASDDGGFFS